MARFRRINSKEIYYFRGQLAILYPHSIGADFVAEFIFIYQTGIALLTSDLMFGPGCSLDYNYRRPSILMIHNLTAFPRKQ